MWVDKYVSYANYLYLDLWEQVSWPSSRFVSVGEKCERFLEIKLNKAYVKKDLENISKFLDIEYDKNLFNIRSFLINIIPYYTY